MDLEIICIDFELAQIYSATVKDAYQERSKLKKMLIFTNSETHYINIYLE